VLSLLYVDTGFQTAVTDNEIPFHLHQKNKTKTSVTEQPDPADGEVRSWGYLTGTHAALEC